MYIYIYTYIHIYIYYSELVGVVIKTFNRELKGKPEHYN